MRAFTLDGFDATPGLRDDRPTPAVGPAGVLVRVHASSVAPVDAAIASGMLKGLAEYAFPVTLGRDYAGVVEKVGTEVSRYRSGDEVFGFVLTANPTVHDGSWSEYILLQVEETSIQEEMSIAVKPHGVDFASAGAAPLAGLTALAAKDALKLTEGTTVVVVGASGGVGSFFVQLAAAAGARVIAPALPEDREYLGGLGVSDVIDRNADVAAHVREHHPQGVDAILDLVSFTSPDDAVLNWGGRLASSLGAAGEGPGRTNLTASPTTSKLERLAHLLDTGALRVPIQHTYPLEQAGTALETLTSAHTQGKLAITIAD